MRNRNGFTTIELLIVTIIVGVLAAIAGHAIGGGADCCTLHESLRNERCKEP